MNEYFNLVRKLKDCPQGTKLYSPLAGEVLLCLTHEDDDNLSILVETKDKKQYWFNSDGTYYMGLTLDDNYIFSAECLLFPSKENRDWSTFEYVKPKFDSRTLHPFEKVLVRNGDRRWWQCSLFSHIIYDTSEIVYWTLGGAYKQVVPYNEETKHLLGTEEEAPKYYRYWEK